MANEEARDARVALQKKITELTESASSPTAVLRLAEAYAWTVSASQPHGGGNATPPS